MREFFRKLVSPVRRLDTYLKERNWRSLKSSLSGGMRLSLSQEGFQIHGPKEKVIFVPWLSINSINAYQVDLFSLEMICVEIYWGAEFRVEINEHMEGYSEVMDVFRNTFEGFDRDWYEKVTFPPLKPNFTELWKRV